MVRILGIAGEKQSGKSSTGNFITGYQMYKNRVIENFAIDENGSLIVPTKRVEGGETIRGEGILDLARLDEGFIKYAQYNVWPHVQIFNLADPLKQICHLLFDLPLELLYGTDDYKNTLTRVRWEDLPGIRQEFDWNPELGEEEVLYFNKEDDPVKYVNEEYLTVREVLQQYGDVCRAFDQDCFVNACIKNILASNTGFAIVCDVRYLNEIRGLREVGGKIIKLTKSVAKPTHKSENISEIPDEEFDAIIPNSDLDIHGKNDMVLEQLQEWGWV